MSNKSLLAKFVEIERRQGRDAALAWFDALSDAEKAWVMHELDQRLDAVREAWQQFVENFMRTMMNVVGEIGPIITRLYEELDDDDTEGS